MDLSNRAYIITGASGGLGRLIAEELAQQGSPLLLSCRDASKLDALVHKYGGQIQVFSGDLTQGSSLGDFLQAMGTFAEEIRKQGNTVYGLVNAIGTPARTDPNTTDKEFRRILESSIQVNYKIPEQVANYFAQITEPDEAIVLFFSSQHRLNKTEGKAAYWLPKFHLERFALRLAVGYSHLKVNTILPGNLGLGMSAGKKEEYQREGTLVDQKFFVDLCLEYLRNPPDSATCLLIVAENGTTTVQNLSRNSETRESED